MPGNEEDQWYAVRGSDVTIHFHTLDLAQPPERLLAEISQLAKRLAVGVAAPAVDLVRPSWKQRRV